LGGKPGFVAPVDRLPSPGELNEQELLQHVRRVGERARYGRLRLPDGDTTDAESQNRRQAQEIVDRAIQAMGGLERMLAVRDKAVVVIHYNSRLQRWEHAADRYYLRGEMFRDGRGESGYDGKQSWHYRYGVLLPARTCGTRPSAGTSWVSSGARASSCSTEAAGDSTSTRWRWWRWRT
jgi:hypothetical protein